MLRNPSWLWPLSIALLGVAIVAFGIAASTRTPDRFTEFYLLPEKGATAGYPSRVELGQDMDVVVGIVNLEQKRSDYSMEVWAIGGEDPNQRDLVAKVSTITVEPEQRLEESIRWQMTQVGSRQQVEFLLFIDDGDSPYRRLHLWVDVEASQPALPG